MAKFIEISNQQIYETLNNHIKNSNTQHNEIIQHQLHTNGRVGLNRWIASTALTVVLLVVGKSLIVL